MIERQQNWLGQQRVDVPHLRSLESSVAHDFDVLAGKMLGGEQPLVLKGFNLTTNGAVGAPATSLQLNVAGAMIVHYGASEAGSMLSVAEGVAAETLSSTNPILSGSFTSSTTNYLGLDLTRSADDTTSDNVQFLGAGSTAEVSKIVPLARTLKYSLVVSTQDFTSRPTVLPLAKIVTDANNNVVSIEDARQLMFRLGSGGDFPNTQNAYLWPQTRFENYAGDAFLGGDKSIGSMKDWMDAVMTRLQELGGGEFWFSATADRNVDLLWRGVPFSNGENFEWTGTNLHWKGLRFTFDNSTSFVNVIADRTTNVTGLTDLALDECIYVDLDRTVFTGLDRQDGDSFNVGDVIHYGYAYECIQAGTTGAFTGPYPNTGADITDGTVHWKFLSTRSQAAIVPRKGALSTLGASVVPGARQILAWRVGNQIYTRGWRYPVGTIFTPATSTSIGAVVLSRNVPSPENALPVVISSQGGQIDATRNTAPASSQIVGLWSAANYWGLFGEGEAPTFTQPTTPGFTNWLGTHIGVVGHADSSNGYGVLGYTTSGTDKAGVLGLSSGITMTFPSFGRYGVAGIGFNGGGVFWGGAGNACGVTGYGIGNGAGGYFTGGSGGTGVGILVIAGGSGVAVDCTGSVVASTNVQAGNGYNFNYNVEQGGLFHVLPNEITVDIALGGANDKYVNNIGSGDPFLSLQTTASYNGFAKVHVPCGATITGAQFLVTVVGTPAAHTITNINMGKGVYNAGGLYTYSSSLSGGSIVLTNASGPSWYTSSGTWTNRTLADTGEEFFVINFTMPAASAGHFELRGIVVNYLYSKVRPTS